MQLTPSPQHNLPQSRKVEYSAKEIGKRAQMKYFTRVKIARRSLIHRLKRSPFFRTPLRAFISWLLILAFLALAIFLPLVLFVWCQPQPQSTTIVQTPSGPDQNYVDRAMKIFYSTPGMDNRPALEYLAKQTKKAQTPAQRLDILLVAVEIYNIDSHFQDGLDLLLKFNIKNLPAAHLKKYYTAISQQYTYLGDTANAHLYQRKGLEN